MFKIRCLLDSIKFIKGLIEFIKSLIARKINFEVNLGINWKKLKFLSNYNFLELIWSNQGLNCINIEVWWPIRNLIEEIWNQGPNWKKHINMGVVIDRIKGQIEEIESLLINWGSNCINLRPRIDLKKAANFKARDWIWQGCNWIDFYNQNCNLGLDWTNYKLRTDLDFDTFLAPFPFKWNCTFCAKQRRFIYYWKKEKEKPKMVLFWTVLWKKKISFPCFFLLPFSTKV